MIGGLSLGRGWQFFSSPPCPDWHWGPRSLLPNGNQGLFPWGKAAGAWNLTTHTVYWRGQRMRVDIPPFPIRLHGVVLS